MNLVKTTVLGIGGLPFRLNSRNIANILKYRSNNSVSDASRLYIAQNWFSQFIIYNLLCLETLDFKVKKNGHQFFKSFV